MSRPNIAVIGSINTDMCVFVDSIPARGETVLGERFVQTRGGKGANQAVAAARVGAQVTFIGRVGNDGLGREAIAALKAEEICTDYVSVDPDEPSGVALIFIDRRGENTIAVAPGANNKLSADEVSAAEEAVSKADYLLLQLEIPLESVLAGMRIARRHDVPVLLNPAPAPATPLPDELLSGCRVITPNREELNRLVPGAGGLESAAARLSETGRGTVIITLGSEGALLCGQAGVERIPAFDVTAIDAVGAGDCFSGALAVALAEGRKPADAARFASAAAALSVERQGAQASMPFRSEIEEFLNSKENGERTW